MLLRKLLLAALVSAAVPEQSSRQVTLSCPDDYCQLGTSCYLVSSDTHGGADASHVCRSHNGTVAVIESDEEMDLLIDSLLETTVYIGVNLQDIRRELFEYALKLSGHAGYLRMKPGEPDNSGGEDCLVADSSAGFNMTDVRCSETHPVLCKVAAEVLPAPPPTTPTSTPPTTTPAVKQCPPDASQYDPSTCFWSSSRSDLTWSQAAEECHSRGMSLASIHSRAENNFIYDMMRVNSWIGLADEDHTDTFQWTDGTALDYEHWYSDQPDGGDQDCAWLGSGTGWWYDEACSTALGVVCRGPPDYLP